MKLQQIYCVKLFCFVIGAACFLNSAIAQDRKYTTANAHSHNDYEHPQPFHTAYNAGFGSIEADIFLRDGKLMVAHNAINIRRDRTLEALYLEPLQAAIKKNNGHVYADSLKQLLLLIDVKTGAEPTLDALVKLVEQYKQLTDCSSLKIAISGNRPAIDKWSSYPAWVYFDGRPKENYTPDAVDKLALISDNLRNYTHWNGEGIPDDEDRKKIETVVKKVHDLKKPIRFWSTPDLPNAWQQLILLNVDYINTDKIQELAEFMLKQPALQIGK